jgi:hypothetical protein
LAQVGFYNKLLLSVVKITNYTSVEAIVPLCGTSIDQSVKSMIIKVFWLGQLRRTPFSCEEDLAFLETQGIVMVDNILDCDVIMTARLPRLKPIHYGADNKIYGDFSSDSFIDYSNFSSPTESFEFIERMTVDEFRTRMNRCLEVSNTIHECLETYNRYEQFFLRIVKNNIDFECLRSVEMPASKQSKMQFSLLV